MQWSEGNNSNHEIQEMNSKLTECRIIVPLFRLYRVFSAPLKKTPEAQFFESPERAHRICVDKKHSIFKLARFF
jgi:hypothetical protein